MEIVYCVKCKKNTENSGKIIKKKTSNGHNYLLVKCKKCNIYKSLIYK